MPEELQERSACLEVVRGLSAVTEMNGPCELDATVSVPPATEAMLLLSAVAQTL